MYRGQYISAVVRQLIEVNTVLMAHQIVLDAMLFIRRDDGVIHESAFMVEGRSTDINIFPFVYRRQSMGYDSKQLCLNSEGHRARRSLECV